MKFDIGNFVFFDNKIIYNIKGLFVDKCKLNWLKVIFVEGYYKCGKCYIEEVSFNCGYIEFLKGNIVGGYVWNFDLKEKDKSLCYYIFLICKRYNK